jgi:hypothetical protein
MNRSFPPRARALPSFYCRLPAVFEAGGVEKTLGRHGSARQDVTADMEGKNW